MYRLRRIQLCSSAVLVLVLLFAATVAAHAQLLPVTHKNSTYFLLYDAEKKQLDCISENTDCSWRIVVSRTVPSFNDIAAIATAAGPVIVYTEENGNTYFALPHFRTGSLTVENSGEPLKGLVGQGRLLNCMFHPEEYGAKMICQLAEPGNAEAMREYKWDINMWGTHKNIDTSNELPWPPGATPNSQRVVNNDLKIKFDVPRGFRLALLDENSLAMYGPTDNLFMTIFSTTGAAPIEELGEAYMAELGVTVTYKSMEQLDNGNPALLLMGDGTIEGVPSLHAGIIFSNNDRTWVLSYTGRVDLGNAYVNSLLILLNSIEPLQ